MAAALAAAARTMSNPATTSAAAQPGMTIARARPAATPKPVAPSSPRITAASIVPAATAVSLIVRPNRARTASNSASAGCSSCDARRRRIRKTGERSLSLVRAAAPQIMLGRRSYPPSPTTQPGKELDVAGKKREKPLTQTDKKTGVKPKRPKKTSRGK
jgi:hypothetical protein